MARTRQQEAALRAARMMQDDIYRGIGATDRPSVDGGEADPRAEARRMATDLTRGGTQPLRDEMARDGGHTSATARMAVRDMGEEDEDSAMMSRAKMGMKPKAKGY